MNMENEKVIRAKQLYEEGKYEEAHSLFLEAAEEGSAEAMYNLSWDYYEGTGVEADTMEAWEWIKRAYETDPLNDKYFGRRNLLSDICIGIKAYDEEDYERAFKHMKAAADEEDEMAMFNTALMLGQGLGTEKNTDEAYVLFKKLADRGYEPAYCSLGDLLLAEWSGPSDPSEIISWYDRYLECDPEDAEDVRSRINNIQELHEAYRQLEAGNISSALHIFRKYAEEGIDMARYEICRIRINGLSDEVSDKEAFDNIKAAADNNNYAAFPLLSIMYSNGIGTQQDLEAAQYWLSLSSENDESTKVAEENLNVAKSKKNESDAEWYENEAARLYGEGNVTGAFENYKKAAELGKLTAMRDLSVLYANGMGTAKDTEAAFFWMKKAADEGLIFAHTDLAKMYAYGIGTKINYEKAIEAAEHVMQFNPNTSDAADVIRYAKNKLEQLKPSAEKMFYNGVDCHNAGRDEEALEWFLRSAEAGNSYAMLNVSYFFLNGMGTAKDTAKALEWLIKSAEAGNPGACNSLALKYSNGWDVPKDIREAAKWADKAVELDPANQEYRQTQNRIRSSLQNDSARSEQLLNQGMMYIQQNDFNNAFRCFQESAQLGNPAGMNNLSVCYSNGDGVAQDKTKSFEWMKKAAEAGFTDSYIILANKYFTGNGTDIDLDQAMDWAEKARKAYPQDQGILDRYRYISEEAEMLYSDNPAAGPMLNDRAMIHVNQNEFGNAFQCFLKAAELGNPDGMNNVSVCYANGHGTEADPVKSFEWMKNAAEAGNTSSYITLANKYFSGDGTEKDLSAAKYWAEKACQAYPQDQNLKDRLLYISNAACNEQPDKRSVPGNRQTDPDQYARSEQLLNQGMMYIQQNDFNNAFRCFQESAQLGNPAGMNNLSVCYFNGDGVAQDKTKSFEWMKKAAEAGFADCFIDLAGKYYYGLGTEIDMDAAYYWSKKACEAYPQNQNYKNQLQYISEEAKMLSSKDPSVADMLVQRGMAHVQQEQKKNAFKFFMKAAEFGNRDGINNVSHSYEMGYGIQKDMFQAFAWRKKLAEMQDAFSCFLLAGWCYDGLGTERNFEQAKYWAEEACRLDPQNNEYRQRLTICNNTLNPPGFPKVYTTTVKKTYREPKPVLINGADLAETEDLIRKGEQLRNEKRYEEALDCFEQAGKTGHYKALRHLGEMLYYGQGAEKSLGDASMFLNAAALRGDEYSEEFLCKQFRCGYYVNPWKIKANLENKQGSENYLDDIGFAEGCREIIDAYNSGHLFFNAAIDHNNPDALCSLANLRRNHTFLTRNAVIPLTNAALAGHSHAMYMLGAYLSDIDKKTSDEFFEEAAKRGNSKAQAYFSFGKKY